MKELQNIINAFDRAQAAGMQSALATVVHVEGSSYRRPGARMLVTENGQFTGAISGGCLEGDALRKAQYAMLQCTNKLVTYDTTDEDDARVGVGLGCQGIIHILIEPIDTDRPDHPVQLLKKVVDQREPSALVTLFSLQHRQSVQPGTCLLQLKNGSIFGNIHDLPFKQSLLEDVQAALQEGKAVLRDYTFLHEQLTAFIGIALPAVSLVIAGAGNDAIPLAQMADLMGWRVTVADGRAHYATRERFPAARLLVSRPEHVLDEIKPDHQTFFVLMTHTYSYDITLLRQLLHLSTPYIGVLGPKAKLDRMLNELQVEGIASGPFPDNLYGPVGLDIGSETPEEIALSIMAEIRAVLTGRPARSLRSSKTVHPRV